MEMTNKERKASNWRLILIVLAIVVFIYAVFVMYSIGNLRSKAQAATDFWFRDVGIGGIEGGVSSDICDYECSKLCLGPRPNMNPLNTTLLLPISRARICCHDKCNYAACKIARPDDTICGHRIDGWSVFAPAGFLSCIFETIK